MPPKRERERYLPYIHLSYSSLQHLFLSYTIIKTKNSREKKPPCVASSAGNFFGPCVCLGLSACLFLFCYSSLSSDFLSFSNIAIVRTEC